VDQIIGPEYDNECNNNSEEKTRDVHKGWARTNNHAAPMASVFGSLWQPDAPPYFVVANCLMKSSSIPCSFRVNGLMRACMSPLAFCMATGYFSTTAVPAGDL
jgi:hypothetical protein